MNRRMTLSLVSAIAAATLALPTALAMDSTKVATGGPDLSAVRASIKKEAWQEAMRLLQPLTKSHPKSADVFNLLGFAQRKTGQFGVSLKSYTRALELDPAHLEAHVYLGELYIQTKQLDKAIAQSKIIAKLCPKGCKPRAELEAALAKATW